jgi:predicted flap endonuclease-1-like 5' DNA nuclease
MLCAQRTEPARRALRRRRDRVVRDLALLAAGEGPAVGPEALSGAEREDSLSRIRESRIAELEHALEAARMRADAASAEAAAFKRQLDHGGADSEELARLRGLVAAHDHERAREIEIEAEAVPEEDMALQAWRLRYFEQRVRFLEEQARAPAPGPAPEAPADLARLDWRARDAEARAAHLEQELRALAAAPAGEAAPIPASPDVDAMLRWRLVYLERRAAHMQAQTAMVPAAEVSAPPGVAQPDPDRWKWRARYLEARVRHLEQRPAPSAVAGAAPERERVVAARPVRRGVKPPVLASARNGAPDDLTLIEGVSLQQQSTFYSLGVFHFDQIAAWSTEHVAWVDQYLRLGGRIDEEEWVDQAAELARPVATHRVLESAAARPQ